MNVKQKLLLRNLNKEMHGVQGQKTTRPLVN